MDLFGTKEREFNRVIKVLEEKIVQEQKRNSILLTKLVNRERFYIGDTFWSMLNNKPTEFVIIKVIIDNDYISTPQRKKDVQSERHRIFANEIFGDDGLNTAYLHEFSVYQISKTKKELIERL